MPQAWFTGGSSYGTGAARKDEGGFWSYVDATTAAQLTAIHTKVIRCNIVKLSSNYCIYHGPAALTAIHTKEAIK